MRPSILLRYSAAQHAVFSITSVFWQVPVDRACNSRYPYKTKCYALRCKLCTHATGVFIMDSTQQLAAHFCTLNTLVEDAYLVPPRTTIKKTLASIKDALDAPLKAHARECADIPDNAFWMECWMARFELLTPFKNILQRCYRASPKNPIILLDQPQHIYWNFHTMVLQRTGIAPEQVLSKTLFLTSAYLAAMPAWLTDQTPDLAETTPILTRRIHDPSFISFLKELV